MQFRGESQFQVFLTYHLIATKFIASIVYTHLWIAICAAAMVLQSSFLLTGTWRLSPLVWFTFGGTLGLYAVHRLIGLQKLKALNTVLNPRYIIINRDQQIVFLFGLFGGVLGAYYFFQLQSPTQYWLILPAIISIAYVLPFLAEKKRLRDIGILKIFLIALAYALITVPLVHTEEGQSYSLSSWILFIEKAFFIFAITIPFDIRDLEVDQISKVKTLPKILGIQNAIRLAQGCILLCILLVFANDYYSGYGAWAMTVAYLMTLIYLNYTSIKRTDLFYAFGMDGMMILQTLLLFIASIVR